MLITAIASIAWSATLWHAEAQCQTAYWPATSGNFDDISVGADGVVVALNNEGNVYKYAGPNSPWMDISGTLTQISAGNLATMWGTIKNSVYYLKPYENWWVPVDGSLKMVSVAGDGTVWGVDSNDNIFYRNSDNTAWVQVSGLLKMVSVGASGLVWGVNSNDNIYYRNSDNTGWVQVPGLLKWVDVSSDGDVWGVSASDNIYYYLPESNSWQQVCGSMKKIEVDGPFVVGLDSNDEAFIARRSELFVAPTTASPTQAPTEVQCLTANWPSSRGWLDDISVGAGDLFCGVNYSNLYLITMTEPETWVVLNQDLRLTQMSCGSAANVWGVNQDNNVYYRNAEGTAWVQVYDMPLKMVSVAADGTVWGVNLKNDVYYRNADNTAWVLVNAPGYSFSMVSVGASGLVWGINENDQVYYVNSDYTAWVQVSGSLKWLDVSSDGDVWGVDSNDDIFYYLPESDSWQQVCGSLKQISIDGDVIAGIDPNNGAFWIRKSELLGEDGGVEGDELAAKGGKGGKRGKGGKGGGGGGGKDTNGAKSAFELNESDRSVWNADHLMMQLPVVIQWRLWVAAAAVFIIALVMTLWMKCSLFSTDNGYHKIRDCETSERQSLCEC